MYGKCTLGKSNQLRDQSYSIFDGMYDLESNEDLNFSYCISGAPEHMWTRGLVHTIFWDKALKLSYF